MPKSVYGLYSLVILSIQLSSCGVTKNMNEMSEKTSELLELTRKMQRTTDHMDQSTSKMVDQTGGMYELTEGLYELTKKMSVSTDELRTLTQGMSEATVKLLELSSTLATLTAGMDQSTKEMLGITKFMSEKTTALHELTAQMKAITQGMGVDTKDMKGMTAALLDLNRKITTLTREMHTKTGMLYRMAREGGARSRRVEDLNLITKPGIPIENRLTAASTYVRSFEFQSWQNLLDDSEERRGRLFAAGVEEFLSEFRGIIDGVPEKPDPTSIEVKNYDAPPVQKKKEKMQALLALSYALNEIDELQREASVKAGSEFKRISMLDLIVSGLLAEKGMNETNGTNYPDYVQEVLELKTEAKYVLDLRVHMLSGMVISTLADAPTKEGFAFKVSLALNALGFKDTWKVSTRRLNVANYNQMTQHLQQARLAALVLKKLNYPFTLAKRIKRLLAGAQFEVPTADVASAQAVQNEAFLNFKKELEAWNCELNAESSCKPETQVISAKTYQEVLKIAQFKR